MSPKNKRTTIYLDPDLHKALRLKSANISRPLSELVNHAVREALAKDTGDTTADNGRVKEPVISYNAQSGKIKREFTVVIERDEDGYFIGTVPQFRGCHTQAKSLDKLMERVKESVLLCLESEGEEKQSELQFIGVQRITV